jgi:1-deoxy-D-xylulose-5-phosphate reductoisomerase
MSKKRIAILGSSGTIGVNTLKVCRHLANELEVVGLAVNSNVERLAEQVKEFKPKMVSIMKPELVNQFKEAARDSVSSEIEITTGIEGLVKLACHPEVDMVVVATVGAIGLLPTLEAIRAGKAIALANKEVLVMAGELVMKKARDNKVSILPIDSEHNAIFQCLQDKSPHEVKKLILTASGGPFRNHRGSFDPITPEQALKHPTWNMGRKISIDSATLMNKGFELIECTHLFDVPPEKVEVVIHPQSIIHSMVEFVDGSILSQMGVTDMFLPIQFSLTFPRRMNTPFPSLDLTKVGSLTFEKPDMERFPCLRLGYESIKIGGTLPSVMNAANEIAVQAFLDRKISFPQLSKLIEMTMQRHDVIHHPTLEELLQSDQWARKVAKTIIEQEF